MYYSFIFIFQMKTLSLAGFETKTLVTHSCFLFCVLQWWAALHLQETCKVESDMLQMLTISNKKYKYWIWWKRLCFLFFSALLYSYRLESGLSAELQTKLKQQCRGGRSQRRGVVSTPPHQGDHLLWFWPNKHSPCTVYFLNTTNH